MNKKGIAGISFGIFVVFLIVIGIIFSIYGINYKTLVNGRHTGTITSIEESGIIWKTTTVYFKSDAQSSQEDSYCLVDKSLIPILEEKSKNKEKVTLIYEDFLFRGWKYCGKENGGIITGLE